MRPRRLRKPLPPSAVALAYASALQGMLAHARELVHERLLARLPEFAERVAPIKTDAMHPGKRVNKILDQVSDAFFRRWNLPRMEALAVKFTTRTERFAKDQLESQIQSALGVSLPAAVDRGIRKSVDAAVSRNVSLIKSIPQTYFEQVEKITVAGLAGGRRHEAIAKDLEERFGVAESSARLVARDQTLTAMAEVNRIRQENMGVTRYIWRSVQDERVRNAHDEFDGNTYSWDDPPGDGSPQEGTHPGTAINCRCYADPILDDLLVDEPAEQTPDPVEQPPEPAEPIPEPVEQPPEPIPDLGGPAGPAMSADFPDLAAIFGESLHLTDSSEEARTHLANLQKIPSRILTSVRDAGLQELRVGSAPARTLGGPANEAARRYVRKEYAGVYDPKSRSLAAGYSGSKLPTCAIHEFGHALDNLLSPTAATWGHSNSPEFLKAFNLDIKPSRVIGDHYRSMPEEAFAQVFAEYIVDGDKARSKWGDRAVDYVQGIVGKL